VMLLCFTPLHVPKCRNPSIRVSTKRPTKWVGRRDGSVAYTHDMPTITGRQRGANQHLSIAWHRRWKLGSSILGIRHGCNTKYVSTSAFGTHAYVRYALCLRHRRSRPLCRPIRRFTTSTNRSCGWLALSRFHYNLSPWKT